MGFFSLFSQSLINEKYIFFDVETTGLFPLADDKIIEIAMIKTEKGKIIDTINTIINPEKPIPEEASKINNITNEMVKDQPAFTKEFGEKIIDFIEDATLIAHNAIFDISFLSVELGHVGITFDRWKAIDTLKIANELFPGQKNRLSNLMRRYNILPEGELHRALIDTDGLRKIFFEFLEESIIRNNTIDQLIKKFGFKGQHVHKSIPAKIRESIIEKKTVSGSYKTREGKILDISFFPIAPVWVDKKWYLLVEEKDTKNILTLYCNNFIKIQN